MAFNSADTAAFKNVWVFCEQRQGVMMPTTFELISEGRKLANELGVELCGILLGDNVDGIAAELGEYGADKVYVYNSPLLKDFTTDAYTKVIVEAVEELKPEVLLFGASNIGRDLAPRCAARLHTGLCADCTHLDIDMPNYKGFLKEASTLPEERIEKLGTVKIAAHETNPDDRHRGDDRVREDGGGPYAGADERTAFVLRPGGIGALPGGMLTAFVAGQHESCPVALAADREGHP